MSEIRHKLEHALTMYNERQSKKKSYNMYALGQYLQRIDLIMEDIRRGADVRKAIIHGFTGRLQDICLKAMGMEKAGDDEQPGGVVYQPVIK